MPSVGQTPTTTTTGSGGGPGNAFTFNRGPDPDAVPSLPAEGTGDDTVAVEESTQVSEAEVQAVEEASRYGWMDKDAWIADGRDPNRWRPATEFLDVRRGVTAIVQEENAALKTKLATLEAKLNERERKETEAQGKFTLETLQLERKQARENGDWDKVDQLDSQIMDLRLKQVATPPPAQPALPPELQSTLLSFREQNQAIFKDRDLTVDFTVRLKAIIDSGVEQDIGKALQHAKRMVMRDNPDKFRAKVNGDTRRTAMTDTAGSQGVPAATQQSWTRLKPEYRRVAENDIRKGLYSREEYLAQCDDSAFMR